MLHLSGGPKLLPLAFLFKSSLPIIDTYIGEKLCQNLRSREDLEMRNAGTYPKSSPIPVLYQVADHLGKGHGALGHDRSPWAPSLSSHSPSSAARSS